MALWSVDPLLLLEIINLNPICAKCFKLIRCKELFTLAVGTICSIADDPVHLLYVLRFLKTTPIDLFQKFMDKSIGSGDAMSVSKKRIWAVGTHNNDGLSILHRCIGNSLIATVVFSQDYAML